LLPGPAACLAEVAVNRSIRSLVLMTMGVATLALWPADASAQRRVVHVGIGVGYYRPYYSRPYYYRSYFSPYYSFYSPFFYDPFFYDGWFGYGQYPPYWGGYPRYYEAGSDLRVQVTPREAEVYLDGYLVGNVDDFDGMLQRLRVPYGEHEVTVYKEGFHSFRQRMLFRPGESYRIRETLQPMAAGEPPEPRPAPSGTPATPQGQGPPRRGGPAGPPPPRGQPPIDRGDRASFGTVSIRVQPADAEVFVDGDRWDRPEGDSRLLVELSEGTHRIEIRKSGFKDYSSTVRVRRGETVPLNVSLPPGD